jgi:hypothetical protein
MTDLIERLRNVAGFLESEGMVASANVVRPAADEIERLRRELAEARGALQELRIRLHAAGRRPEECYEMSVIDTALAADQPDAVKPCADCGEPTDVWHDGTHLCWKCRA